MDIAAFALGVGASVVAWLFVMMLLRPKLVWANALIRTDHPPEHVPLYTYCATFRNRRWLRSAVEVRVVARMRIKGLSNGTSQWSTFDIPCDSAFIPRLRPALTRGGPRTQFSSLLLDEISDHAMRKLPEFLRNELRSDASMLERIFQEGEQAELYFTASCEDGFSGVRRVFVSTTFRAVTSRQRSSV